MIAMLVLAALPGFLNYAPTPQEAAIEVVNPPRSQVVVLRTNVDGPYAMVLLHGASMEGAPIAAPILLKHFSFGWQTLALVNSRCEIAAYDLGSRAETLLMQGMPAPKDDRPCKGIWKDAGPQAQVDAIRLQMSHALIPSVVVAGDYALGEWYGAGGGQTLFHFTVGSWHRIAGGGGAMGIEGMREYGVPQTDWCAFHIYGAKCP